MKKYFLPFCLLLLALNCQAQQQTAFEIKDGEFYVNNTPTTIISGEMHYPRIPHQYWRHRFQMMKAMGLNAVATYVFWNLHEVEPNSWDFEGDKNIADYIRIAGEEGLMVILRPGPYVCAEWEFGGYPWWLQNVEGMEVRRNDEQFLHHTKRYIDRLYKEVGELLCTNGGPIVMVQCENEFGSYVKQRSDISIEEHRAYNAAIKQQLIDAGFDVPMFTSDGTWLFEGGTTQGALPTANGEKNIERLKESVNQYNGGQGPYMVAEFYTGWLAHWCEPHPNVDDSRIARLTENYLRNDVSINFYMVHGGTNFAFTSGANYDRKRDIQPDLTSYDYDAPISEAGWITPKYDSIRNVVKKYVKHNLPEPPAPIPTIEIPSIKLDKVAPVLDYLEGRGATAVNSTPLTFEQLGQGYGYVLYSCHFNHPIGGLLEIPGLRDYATVYVDGEKVGVLNRNTKTYSMEVEIPFNATLQILVENMGRINYGDEIVKNTKGIISPVLIDGQEIAGDWEMYGLPMDTAPRLSELGGTSNGQNDALTGTPVFYEGTFELATTGDTFVDMSGWGKGIVFVNGHNLGRYWGVGPQQTLYLPGVWLNRGENRIVVFEQLNDVAQTEIKTTNTPILTDLQLNKR